MNPYTFLAKKAVENFIEKRGTISPPEDLPEEFFKERSGIFVTITQKGQLRGCIGTYLPSKENIALEIINNAVAAATRDFRFKEIAKEDLPHLKYSVSVLSRPEQVKSLDDLDPEKYGILISNLPKNKEGSVKSSLLLPCLEGIDTAEKQVETACYKAGIDPGKEQVAIFRFTTKVYQ